MAKNNNVKKTNTSTPKAAETTPATETIAGVNPDDVVEATKPTVEATSVTETPPVEEPVMDVTPVTEEAPVDMVEDRPVVTPENIDVPEDLSPLEAYFERYSTEMAPRVPLTEKLGAMNQYTLWKTLEDVMNKTDNDTFKKEWNIILNAFNEGKDKAFNPRYIYRFSESWQWSKDDLETFQKVINLILLTANPAERALGLKQVDFDVVFRSKFSETAKQNLSSFYR